MPLENKTEGECLTLFRIEDASVSELNKAFQEIVTNNSFKCQEGSVILISAGGYLARVGASAYAEEIVAAILDLKNFFRNSCFISHGLIMPLSGTTDVAFLRALFDIQKWYSILSSTGAQGDFLPKSHATLCDVLKMSGRGDLQHKQPLKLLLPVSLDEKKAKVWLSSGKDDIPMSTHPMSEKAEKKLISTLVEELNAMLGLRLATSISVEKSAEASSNPENSKPSKCVSQVILVGCEQAGDLFGHLAASGISTIHVPLVELTNHSIHRCKELLEKILTNIESKDKSSSLVVFQILDNDIYMANGERGIVPGEKDCGGVVHIPGDLLIAPKQWLKSIITRDVNVISLQAILHKFSLEIHKIYCSYPYWLKYKIFLIQIRIRLSKTYLTCR